MRRAKDATLAEVMNTTRWQVHTCGDSQPIYAQRLDLIPAIIGDIVDRQSASLTRRGYVTFQYLHDHGVNVSPSALLIACYIHDNAGHGVYGTGEPGSRAS